MKGIKQEKVDTGFREEELKLIYDQNDDDDESDVEVDVEESGSDSSLHIHPYHNHNPSDHLSISPTTHHSPKFSTPLPGLQVHSPLFDTPTHKDLSPFSTFGSKRLRRKGKTWFPCSICDKKFDRPSLLTRHVRIHTGLCT